MLIEVNYKAFILKSCELGSEDCVNCLTDVFNSQHAMCEKITAGWETAHSKQAGLEQGLH